ncbi:hypothetical protein Tco_0388290, partial [Tanacetum coccineum]
QRDYFSNDTFRGRSLVSSDVYYEVTPPDILPLRHAFLGVLHVRRMIPEPGDANRAVPVNETFHEQTDDELNEKELKQVEAIDQAKAASGSSEIMLSSTDNVTFFLTLLLLEVFFLEGSGLDSSDITTSAI